MTRQEETRTLETRAQQLARHFDKSELRDQLRQARHSNDRGETKVLARAVYNYDRLVAC